MEALDTGDRLRFDTFEEAFAAPDPTPADDSPSSSTETPASETAATPADATAPPATETTAPAPDVPPRDEGPIPFERHKKVLEGARAETTAAKEELARLRDQLGWADGMDRQTLEEAFQLGRRYRTDPQGFVRQMLQDALADETVAPLIRSEAARALASGRQPTVAPDELAPDIPVVDEAGKVVGHSYSADRVLQIVKREVAQALHQHVDPLRQDLDTRRAQAQAEATTQAARDWSKKTYEWATQSLPDFEAHRAAIGERYAAYINADPEMDPIVAMVAGWKDVVGSTLGNVEQAKADAVAALKTKAAAGTVNPASAGVASTTRPTGFDDPSLQW